MRLPKIGDHISLTLADGTFDGEVVPLPDNVDHFIGHPPALFCISGHNGSTAGDDWWAPGPIVRLGDDAEWEFIDAPPAPKLMVPVTVMLAEDTVDRLQNDPLRPVARSPQWRQDVVHALNDAIMEVTW